jgi:hypothetical protein
MCVGCAHPTQIMRASHAWDASIKGCHYWPHQYMVSTIHGNSRQWQLWMFRLHNWCPMYGWHIRWMELCAFMQCLQMVCDLHLIHSIRKCSCLIVDIPIFYSWRTVTLPVRTKKCSVINRSIINWLLSPNAGHRNWAYLITNSNCWIPEGEVDEIRVISELLWPFSFLCNAVQAYVM